MPSMYISKTGCMVKSLILPADVFFYRLYYLYDNYNFTSQKVIRLIRETEKGVFEVSK